MKTINEDISLLITRILSGEASGDDFNQLDRWLSLSAENREIFEQYKAIWSINPGNSNAVKLNKTAAWTTILSKLEQAEPVNKKSIAVKRMIYTVSGIAALLLLAVGVFTLLKTTPPEMNSYYATEATPATISLPDGTQLSLKYGSSISYPTTFTGSSRKVALTGEAYFEVQPNPDKPFVVETEHAIIQVLGTAFNVRYNQKESLVEVSVAEGKVSLKPKNESNQLILQAGEQGFLNTLNRQLSKQAFNDYNFLAWKTGILEFNETGLPDVLRVLEQTYGLNAETRSELNNLKLTARFQNEEPGDIFKTIGILFNLQVVQENNTWVLY